MHNINMNKINFSILAFLLVGIMYTFSSCHHAKQVAYFQNIPDSVGTEVRVKNAEYQDLKIHKGDILNIDITTIDAKVGGVVTAENLNSNTQSEQAVKGYMVDKSGYIEMPVVGRIQVEGLTTAEAKELIRTNALKYYKDPLVNVRVANFVVTILGQVKRPGRYVIATEKVNIIDAIALAGDLDIGGKRQNVMLIRDEGGESVFTRIDLNNTNIFQSKYYYLQTGDKIIVEPLNNVARSGTSDKSLDRIISLSLSLVSISIAIISFTTRFNQN